MLKLAGLFLLTIGTVFCADLPREAQRELDSFNAAVVKADAIRQAAVNAAVDKAVKALNTVAKNADTAEERRAIDDEIFALKKLKVEDDLLGDGPARNAPWSAFVGTWMVAISGDRGRWVVKKDGTIEAEDFTHRSTYTSKIEYRREQNDLYIPFPGGKHWATVRLPVGKTSATGDNSFYGANSVTYTKDEGTKP